jgi:hypothetical protein
MAILEAIVRTPTMGLTIGRKYTVEDLADDKERFLVTNDHGMRVRKFKHRFRVVDTLESRFNIHYMAG